MFGNNTSIKNEGEIRSFVKQWAIEIDSFCSNEDHLSDKHIDKFYLNEVSVFGENYNNVAFQKKFISELYLDQNYSTRSMNISYFDKKNNYIKIVFSDTSSSVINSSSIHDNYYIIVLFSKKNGCKISKISSYTFDIWLEVKNRIKAKKNIFIQNSTYHVIDSTLSSNKNLKCYILTDSLVFNSIYNREPCNEESIYGLGVCQNLYFAYFDVKNQQILAISKLEIQTNSNSTDSLDSYVYPLLVYMSSYYSTYKEKYINWGQPDLILLESKDNSHEVITLKFSNPIGDHCYLDDIIIDFDTSSNQISISRVAN